MPVISGKAPGKIILFGEHAVVYGHPAIAIPVNKVKATAHVFPSIGTPPGAIRIQAPDIELDADVTNLPQDHPLASAVRLTLAAVEISQPPSLNIQIASSIPLAAGMGSSAAISVAICRGLSAFLGHPLTNPQINQIAFEVEKIHHGTPSGIDNHVIAYEQPIYFIKDEPVELLTIKTSTHWVIADSGEKTPTRETVADVRKRYLAEPQHYQALFEAIGSVTERARLALSEGDLPALGILMKENQALLEALDVSSTRLENLIHAANTAGALGAKLSGGGRGGNMIALAPPDQTDNIVQALKDAGAVHTITTRLNQSEGA